MRRSLVLLNVLILAVSVAAGTYLVRALTEPLPRPLLRTRPSAAPTSPPAAEPATRPAVGANATVAARNLFSPTRTEAPPPPVAQQRPAIAMPKPNLYGVVLREGTPIAYLEDPATRRVAGYHVGDAIAGGTVQTIDADHVVLSRPDGPLDVKLRDPAKPRPVVQPGTPPVGVPGAPPQPGMPPVMPPAIQSGGGFPQSPGLQPTVQPGQIPAPPARRPLPPNVLRRVPPTAGSDANQPQ